MKEQELRSCHATRTFHPMEARFACGSMERFVSFSQKNAQRAFFCEKDLVSSALPEAEIPSGSVTA
jgi:hypothetical protein